MQFLPSLQVFRVFFFIVMLTAGQYISAVTTSEVFRRHRNPVFIESCSFEGDGIEQALKAGFTEIHSIELSPHYYEICKNRFLNNSKVHLYLGDSSMVLKEILKTLNKRATFWLDGHYSWAETARGDTNTPILAELGIIGEHFIKNHTILIDDVRQFGTIEFDFIDLESITNIISTINPDYQISYEDGHIVKDVLVAEIR